MYWIEERLEEMTNAEVMKITRRWYSGQASTLLDNAELVNVEFLEPDETSMNVPLEVTVKLQVRMTRDQLAHIKARSDKPSVEAAPPLPTLQFQVVVGSAGRPRVTVAPTNLLAGDYIAVVTEYKGPPTYASHTEALDDHTAFEDMYSDHTSEEF